jgi:hypothetical protein
LYEVVPYVIGPGFVVKSEHFFMIKKFFLASLNSCRP